MAAVLETRELTKRYGDVLAVDRISLSVEEGSLFGLLGPNGSGKTTMIRMLTGQIRPSSGSARVLGLDTVKDGIGIRERVGIIPEQESPPSFLTAEEYLSFVGSVRGIQDIGEKAAWWFDFLEFRDKRDVLCKDLSRGTRQKLMFAQAFIHEPVLALIDEPLINLDPLVQETVKEFLEEYVRSGRTIFLSTHLLEVAEEMCSSFAILHQGRLLHFGAMEELKCGGVHLPDFFLSLVRGNRNA